MGCDPEGRRARQQKVMRADRVSQNGGKKRGSYTPKPADEGNRPIKCAERVMLAQQRTEKRARERGSCDHDYRPCVWRNLAPPLIESQTAPPLRYAESRRRLALPRPAGIGDALAGSATVRPLEAHGISPRLSAQGYQGNRMTGKPLVGEHRQPSARLNSKAENLIGICFHHFAERRAVGQGQYRPVLQQPGRDGQLPGGTASGSCVHFPPLREGMP